MPRLQAFKYELMPNGEQQRNLRRFAGACRFVFNKALALQKASHAAGAKFMNYVALANKLPGWKQEFEWLRQAPSQALQQVLKDLERPWKNFFDRRTDLPKFKKKGQREGFRFPQGFKLDQPNSRIFLSKRDWIRFQNSRDILGTAKNITISQAGGQWLASYTSQTCPCCGHVAKENRPSQAQFECVDCGYANHADEHIGAGTPRYSLWRGRLWFCSKEQNETSFCEAGTHRSDYARGHSCLAPQESPAFRRGRMSTCWPRWGVGAAKKMWK